MTNVLRLAGIVLLAAACAGTPRVERSELPDVPLLVTHLDAEQSRRRADLLRELRRERPRQSGILHFDDVERLVRGGLPLPVGRLAWLDPRDGSVTPIPEAVVGARALARSAGGRLALFAAPGREGATQLFELEVASGEVRPRTWGPRAHPMGCYAGAGRLAVVEARGAGTAGRILLSPSPGAELVPLTPGPADTSPACAPDGRSLAYVTRGPGGGEAIAVLDLEPGAEPRVVASGRDPVFTPDGAWIVYSARTTRGARIWRMRPDGSGKLPVGRGTRNEALPAVSPDGRFVAYLGEEEDSVRLRVRRFDGSGDRILLEAGEAVDTAW